MLDLVVDGNSIYARSWYAAQTINPNGGETLRLAAVTIMNLLHPDRNQIGSRFDRTLFCWDAQVNESKNREPKPQEYYDMRDIAKELFTFLLGTNHVEQSPYEGDDLVASAVYKSKPGVETYIVSGDKDLMQLVDKHTHYYSLNEKCVLSEAFVCGKFHVKQPDQIALALAIQGDPVDCVSGVKGWGPARVKKLFGEVTKNMSFDQAVAMLESHMSPEQNTQFYDSLARTLLNTTLTVPEPAPIVFPSEDEVADLGMPELDYRFREVKFLYEENLF